MPERQERHEVPLGLGLGSEPLRVELLRIRKIVLVKVEADDGDVYFRARRNGEPRPWNGGGLTIQVYNFGLLHGYVDFDLGVPPRCPATLPVLPDFHLSDSQCKSQKKSTQPSNKPGLSPAGSICVFY